MPLNPKTIKLEIDFIRDTAVEAGILSKEDAKDYEKIMDAALDVFIWHVSRTYNTKEEIPPDEENRLRLAFLNGQKIRMGRRNKTESARNAERENIVDALLKEEERRKVESENEKLRLEEKVVIEECDDANAEKYIKEVGELVTNEK